MVTLTSLYNCLLKSKGKIYSYTMGTTIYCLACDDVIWYVGRSRLPKARESYHRGKYVSYGSTLIPDDAIWSFIVLELVEDDQAVYAEKFYYDFLQPRLNKNMPGRSLADSKAAYMAAYPERAKEANRRYQMLHRIKKATLKDLLASLE